MFAHRQVVTILLFKINYSIQHYPFICTQSNGTKYCYATPIIQFKHTVKEFLVLQLNTNDSIQHYSFDCRQLNDSKCITSNSIKHQSFIYPIK